MSENLEVDDYVRWLGKQKPVGLAWIGLAILEVAAALFILNRAYIEFSEYNDNEILTEVQTILKEYKMNDN